MKTAGVFAAAAALVAGVAAQGHAGRRHAHDAFHQARALTTGSSPESTCGCTTIYTTITGEATRTFFNLQLVNKEIGNAQS